MSGNIATRKADSIDLPSEAVGLPKAEGKNAAANRAKRAREKRKKVADKYAESLAVHWIIYGSRHLVEGPDYFLFKIKPSPGKRLGVFATSDIPAGFKIFREEPLIASDAEWLPVEAQISALDPLLHENFLYALQARCHCNSDPCTETRIMRIWDTNSFQPADEVVAASPEYGPIAEGRPFSCLYRYGAFLNHSCDSNTIIRYTKDLHIVLISKRHIKKGEEITISYINSGEVGMPIAKRQSLLLEHLNFKCVCEACQNGTLRSEDEIGHLDRKSIADSSWLQSTRPISFLHWREKEDLRAAARWAEGVEKNHQKYVRFFHVALAHLYYVKPKVKHYDQRYLDNISNQIVRCQVAYLQAHPDFVYPGGETVRIRDEVLDSYCDRVTDRMSFCLMLNAEVLERDADGTVVAGIVGKGKNDEESILATYQDFYAYLCLLYEASGRDYEELGVAAFQDVDELLQDLVESMQ